MTTSPFFNSTLMTLLLLILPVTSLHPVNGSAGSFTCRSSAGSMTAVGLRAHPFGISLCVIRPGTGQMKLQIMQLRHLSSTSFGRRVSASHSRAWPPASRQTM